MALVLGSVIFGLILGVIIGTQIKPTKDFSNASYIIIFIVGIIIAWQLGQYPFYQDVPLSTGFLSTLIGLFIGKILRRVI